MKYVPKRYEDLRKRVETMSLDALLDAVVCPIYVLPEEPKRTTSAVMFAATDVKTSLATIEKVNEGREDKALLTADFEFGCGQSAKGAVTFPSMRAVREAGDETLAYEMGAAAAKEGRLAGYHWAFGPCTDILINHRNPIVSIRSAGETAADVIRFTGAYMRGMQDNGMIATLKHFPGDGVASDDQHVTTTENPLSREEWDASFGLVYKTLIEDGAKAVMPGHIALPSYDEIDPETGLYPPATASKNLLTKLLREKLGFEGIIISDAVGMSGLSGYVEFYHASARFLEAGGDCLLFMPANEEYREAMKKEIGRGTLRVETLKNRAFRMLCFSREYFESNSGPISFDRQKAEALSEEIVKRSVKVIRDRNSVLPLSASDVRKIYHVILPNQGVVQGIKDAKDLSVQLEERGFSVTEAVDPGCGAILEAVKSGQYDLVVCSVVTPASYGTNTIKLSGPMTRNMMDGWMKRGVPTVFIAYQDPYFHEDFRASADTVINTYGFAGSTNRYIIRTLFGEP